MKKNNFKLIKKAVSNLSSVMLIVFRFNHAYLLVILMLLIIVTTLPFISLIASQEILNKIQIGNIDIQNVIFLIIIYFAVQFTQTLINIAYTHILSRYQEYLNCEMIKYFDLMCVKLSLKDFENDVVYDMITRAEGQMGVRPMSIINNLLSVFSNSIGLLCSMYLLASWHPEIIIGFLILPIISFKYFKKISNIEYTTMYNRAIKQRKSWYYSYLLTKDYNIKEVQALGLSNYIVEKRKEIHNALFIENIHLLNLKTLFKAGYQILTLIFSVSIIFLAMIETIKGKIYIGNLTTYINTTNRVEKYLSSLTDAIFALYSDSLYSENIIDFFNYVAKKECNEGKRILSKNIDRIEIRNLYYKYEKSSKFALKNINIVIERNDIIAFVGENGSGKTTLIKILLGLYSDYTGEIFVNNINLKQIDIDSFRKKISSIFQDYNNYELTVRENIQFGDIYNIKDDTEIIKAAKLVGAKSFIEKLPKKYSQQVGSWFSEGIQLSGGQWQKLALAKAVIRNADLYIFDEPTSSLDPSSEYLFFENMIDCFKDRIGIFVTHRFINAKLANKIFVFKDGEIIENGTHDELMSNKSEYAYLCDLQINGLEKGSDKL